MSWPCDRCHAPCCREPRVLLSGREALRIAAALGLPLDAFTDFPSRERAEGEYRIALRDAATGQRRYHRMELRQVATPEESHLRRCYFLITQSESVRCGCYDARPRACAAFPYLESGDSVVVSRLGRAYCPKGAWGDVVIDVPAHRLLRREQESDCADYDAVIDAWNSRVSVDDSHAGAPDFLAHLERAYAPQSPLS
jgi:Fe-S-cluster containining protein